MKLPVIRKSYFLNIVILLISLFISWFTLLFGIAHLIEGIIKGRNPNIPYSENLLGFAVVITLCVVGVIFLVVALASIKGILYKLKREYEH